MQLPVFAGKKLKGLITSDQVIDGAVVGSQGQTKVVQMMTEKPLVVSRGDTVGEVLNLFREHGISHTPVVHDGRLQGIVSIQDIIDIAYRSRSRQTLGERVGERVDITDINVEGIMRFPVVAVDPEETLRNCTKKMSETDVSCLVVARNDRVLGIVTKKDFLELVAQTIPQTRPFTVQFSVKPDVRVRMDSQEVMIDAFESFAAKYEVALGSGILFVYIKSLGSAFKGHQLVHCRFQLRTAKGLFCSSSEAWGMVDAFLLALERLERRVLQSKEMELDSEYVRRHIEDYLSSEV